MSGRNSKHKNLLEDDFKLVIDHSVKKAEVLNLLGKILYGVVIFTLFGYGIYFIYLGKQDLFSKDINDFNLKSGEWNHTYLKEFSGLEFSIINQNNKSKPLEKDKNKMHDFEDKDLIYYDPFQFILKNLGPLIQDVELIKKKADDSSFHYNLTTNFILNVTDDYKSKLLNINDVDLFIRAPTPIIKQSECVKNKGLWNHENDICYKYYILRSLCIIIDQDTMELYHDYKKFKCNDFNNWYESYSVFPWAIPYYDPSFDDLENLNKKIQVYVSTTRDPYVWANYNGTLHFPKIAESYNSAGIWMIICSILLSIIPLLVYFKNVKDHNEGGITELVNQSLSLVPIVK